MRRTARSETVRRLDRVWLPGPLVTVLLLLAGALATYIADAVLHPSGTSNPGGTTEGVVAFVRVLALAALPVIVVSRNRRITAAALVVVGASLPAFYLS